MDNFDLDDLFGDDNNTEPLFVDDLLEEWERQDEVKAARQAEMKLAFEKEQAQAELDEAMSEAAAFEQEIRDLENLKRRAQKRAADARMIVNRSTKSLWDTQQEIQNLHESYESRKKAAALAAERAERDKTRFIGMAWHDGVTLPDGQVIKIKDHQRAAAQFITDHGKVLLGDDMGTGKTLSMIAACDYSEAKRILVICPVELTANELNEFRMWAPHRMVTNLFGMSKAQRRSVLEMARNFMKEFTVVINYEMWRKDSAFLDELIKTQFDAIFLDEAHVMKNTASNTYSGAKTIVHARNTCGGCGRLIDHTVYNSVCAHCQTHHSEGVSSLKIVVPMTGTLILNSPEDLFPLLELIDPKMFYSKNRFLNQYAEYDMYRNRYKFSEGGLESLMKRMGTKILRRTLKDVGILLDPTIIIEHNLYLDQENYPDQWRVVQELRKNASFVLSRVDANGEPVVMKAMNVLALMTRERQANVCPAGITIKDPVTDEILLSVAEDVNESIKLDKALEIIQEKVEEGERLVVFSQFSTALEEMQNLLDTAGITSVRLDGSTTVALKEEVKSNFNASKAEEPKWQVVLANYKSGGVGLNLTACAHMIMLDQEWNPGKEDQAIARIRRLGQTRQTFLHLLQIPQSVDTWMRGLIRDKAEVIAGFDEAQQDIQAEYLKQLRTDYKEVE